jgi:hypothetical protein
LCAKEEAGKFIAFRYENIEAEEEGAKPPKKKSDLRKKIRLLKDFSVWAVFFFGEENGEVSSRKGEKEKLREKSETKRDVEAS